jgi:hypothetical protein
VAPVCCSFFALLSVLPLGFAFAFDFGVAFGFGVAFTKN